MSRPLGSYDGCAGGCLCFAPDASYAACTQKRSIREPGINQPAWASLKGLSRIVYTSESPQTPHDARILRIDFYAPTWVAWPHHKVRCGSHDGRQRLLVRDTQPAECHLTRLYARSSYRGSANQNVELLLMELSIPTLPWCCSTIILQLYNPSPSLASEPGVRSILAD
jgi:hypothetical protein